ncbi:MAG: DUF3261 domain-containing protein [Nitrospirae bacterium]|nr:DUF3261 domain-containing protein [Nitrospirota bacterium]
MRRLPAIFAVFLCLSGCTAVPFQKTSYVSMEPFDPWTVVSQFKNNMPDNFKLINTIVFEYNWSKFSGIGYITVDAGEEIFTVVCINPIGIKLFELSGAKDRIDSHFALEQFTKKGNFAGTVGEDIRRVYFNLTPSPEAAIKKKRLQIIFSEPSGAGVVEYIFAGSAGHLTEKNFYEDDILSWRVSYYEYREKDGKFYPGGIVLKNYKYGYSLIIKLKEIAG